MPMAKRVLLATRDLLFRSKLGAVVAAAGAEVSRDEAACDLAVLELAGAGATERIAELVRRGTPVLAGSPQHIGAQPSWRHSLSALRSPVRSLSFRAMTHSTTVVLPPQDVLDRAKRFFAERVPHAAAFVEKEGPGFLVLRGQGGEEIALHVWADAAGKTRVRASTLFFDQALDRFLSTLPLEGSVEVA